MNSNYTELSKKEKIKSLKFIIDKLKNPQDSNHKYICYCFVEFMNLNKEPLQNCIDDSDINKKENFEALFPELFKLVMETGKKLNQNYSWSYPWDKSGYVSKNFKSETIQKLLKTFTDEH
jgi:hypothetical protein